VWESCERGLTIDQVVNYESLPELQAALSGADTLLSFIVDFVSPSSQATAHRNLLSAAVSQGLERFVPAEYANDIARFPVPPSAEVDKLHFRNHLREVCKREKIEYTIMCIGIFMDFFVPPEARKYFPDLEGPLKPAERKMRVNGARGDKVSLTLADDVAKALMRLLQVPFGGWDEYSYVSGDRVTWDQVADALEQVTGDGVEKTYHSLEELESEVIEARKGGDDMAIMMAELNEAFGNGSEVLPPDSKYFEGLRFTKLEELFEKTYTKG
jgi:nucleoside-diphosphate-sugar epimerase